jgi:hypothetical protein
MNQGTPIPLVQGVGNALAQKGEAGATPLEIHKSFSAEVAAAYPLDSVIAYLEENRQRGYVRVAHGTNAWSFTPQGGKAHADLAILLTELPRKMQTGEIIAT